MQKINITDRLKREWDEDPAKVIIVGTAAVTAAAKLLEVVSAAQGRRAYARQVDYKIKHGK